jgi:hypothetical protein
MIELPSSLRFGFIAGALLATAIFCSDCAITPIEVKSEVVNPAEAKKLSVAVIADPYMDDAAAANTLVDLVRKEMTRRGFRLSQTEATAELVIIPHLKGTSGDVPATPVRPAPSINLLTPNIGEPGMMQNGGGLGELPSIESRAALPQDQIQLIVMAIQLDEWRKALIVNQLRVPQVWRISVFAPPDFSPKGKALTAELVEAAGPRFAQLAKQ